MQGEGFNARQQHQVFELERETEGQPLQVLGWHVICSRGLIEELNLDHVRLINFLREVSNAPRPATSDQQPATSNQRPAALCCSRACQPPAQQKAVVLAWGSVVDVATGMQQRVEDASSL